MSRRPARITQADVARAVRAAKQAGAGDVVIHPDGTIIVRLVPSTVAEPAGELAPTLDIVL